MDLAKPIKRDVSKERQLGQPLRLYTRRLGSRRSLVASPAGARNVGALMPAVKKKISRARRRYPIGAELIGENETDFRVWAPKARQVDVAVEDGSNSKPVFHALTPEPGGYFSGTIKVGARDRYRFR